MKRLLTSLVLLAAALVGDTASAQTYRTVTDYDAARRPIKVTDPLGNVAHTFYDADGRVIREAMQAPANQWLVTCTYYSYSGQKSLVIGPYLTTSKDECPSGTNLAVPRAEFGYDGVDRLDNETIRLDPATGQGDRVTRMTYDAAGQVLQIRRGVGSPVEQAYLTYSYTPNGKQQFIIDANGNRAQLTWDGYDRQRCWIFPSTTLPTGFNPANSTTALATAGAVSGDCVTTGDYERYEYDNNGNRAKLRKRDAKEILYTFDGLNRVITKSVPASSTAAAAYNVFYDYDLRGFQISARFTSPTGEGVTNRFDSAGRLKDSTTNMGGTARMLQYEYDKASNREVVTHPDGTDFIYAWDALNRLDSILENGGSVLADPQYDILSRQTLLSFGASTTSYSYDSASRLSGIVLDFAGTNADLTLGFGYNRAGQIISRTQSNDLYANTAHYDVSRSYTRNGLNQYVAAGLVNFTYDLNGNVRTDGVNTFTYDTENRLTAVSGNYTASLVYDPMGRLYQTSGGAPGTTKFLYDGSDLVAEYDGAGNIIRRYVHGAGVDDPLIWYEGSSVGASNRRLLYANQQGSIIASADAGGQIIGTNAYDAWGIPNSTNFGRFAYTGQIAIPEAGIYHYKARAYSPTLGRFLQTDPVGYSDQANLYAYVGNSPIDLIDPSGTKSDYANHCNTAASRLCGAAKETARREQVRAANLKQTVSFIRSLAKPTGYITLAAAVLSMKGDTLDPAAEKLMDTRNFDKGFESALEDHEKNRRAVGFHYTTQAAADIIAQTGVIERNNRGVTYFTGEPYSPQEVHRNLMMGRPGWEARGEAVVMFTYNPRQFPNGPDGGAEMGRVHPGSIRNGRESVTFHYVGENHF